MYTAEFVSPKHPDKMCDQISDAILDWALARDPLARVAIETMGGHGRVFVLGEMTIKDTTDEDIEEAIHGIVDRIAPGNEIDWGVARQSPEIASGVDTGGAGDQGIMKGYATNETETLMPREYQWAREICQAIYEKHPYDGKTQVTIDGKARIKAIVASFQNTTAAELKEIIHEWMNSKDIQLADGFTIYTNPAGDWNQGGFDADTGLTGRKLMVDNYGPRNPIGGGAFSGKDATKVDRSAAYMARRIAVDLLGKMEAQQVSVEIAYAIGVAQPVSVNARVVRNGKIENWDVTGEYDLTPEGMIAFLDLRKPQYEETAKWGHFGRGFTWK